MVPTRRSLILGCAVLVLLAAAGAEEPRLDRDHVEALLRSAEVVDREPLPIGVTHSHRLTLSDGSETIQAVWKTINKEEPVRHFERGLPELGFVDSYKNEIAAYELDKLLQLDMVPPTVERRLGRRVGSLQFWMEGCITEGERFKRKLSPPNSTAWLEQVYKIRLFRQLIHDADYKNASNILCDRSFKIWSVDHSRGFRIQEKLLNRQYLRRFSRGLLAQLRELDEAVLEERLGRWLSKGKRKALLARRDLILDRAAELVAEEGEQAILYP